MSKHQVGYITFGLFTVLYFICSFFYDWSWSYFIIFFASWFLLILYGSFFIRTNYHVKAISKVDTEEKIVAITFDDGPSSFTIQALQLLDQFQQKATFFCVGNKLKENPEIVQQVLRDGHLIANHTFSHNENLGFAGKKKMIQEIQKTDQLIEYQTGQKTKYFRPPFGITNPNIMRALKTTQHTVIGWNIRSLDTVLKKEDKIINRITRQLCPGSIILLHDTSALSIVVLERLLIHLKEQHYKSVTVEHLINRKK